MEVERQRRGTPQGAMPPCIRPDIDPGIAGLGIALTLILTLVCALTVFAAAREGGQGAEPPGIWRLIYVEGGHYREYQQKLAATARFLQSMGLIADGEVPVPDDTYSTRSMWDWLAANAGGTRIKFLRDGWYGWESDGSGREVAKERVLRRISEQGDVDMVLAFGTVAARTFATDEHAVPTLALAVTDPVGAGVIASAGDSGRDHVCAQFDPLLYSRQLKLFHNVFKFKRLGVPLVGSEAGRIMAGLPEIRRMAGELGFELRLCETPPVGDKSEAVEKLRDCLTRLAAESDAVYLTYHPGMRWERMTELLAPIIAAGLPSFSQSGVEETRLGVLMSLSEETFNSAGRHAAEAIRRILGGARPRDVDQVFVSAPGLALNLRMAMRIGWQPTLEVLAAVDSVYLEIKNEGSHVPRIAGATGSPQPEGERP